MERLLNPKELADILNVKPGTVYSNGYRAACLCSLL